MRWRSRLWREMAKVEAAGRSGCRSATNDPSRDEVNLLVIPPSVPAVRAHGSID